MKTPILQSEDLPELVSVREFDAPRELVWKCWTDPEHFPHWFCPKGFTTTLCEMDVRQGGGYRIHWQDKQGNTYPNKAEYREVTPPGRLVYADTWDDDRPENEEVVVTVIFEDLGGRTRMTSRSLFSSHDHLERIKAMGVEAGWAMFLDRLDTFLGELQADEPKA